MEAARKNLAERIDKIEQRRVLGKDDEGRRNLCEEGKDRNAEPKEVYGPGLLFLGNRLRWTGELELAFKNA
jgi:hypothetical protein